MLAIHMIVTTFGAMIFLVPILFPNAKVKLTNRSEK